MSNESKKDFNTMMNNNKDMPKIQIVDDEELVKMPILVNHWTMGIW